MPKTKTKTVTTNSSLHDRKLIFNSFTTQKVEYIQLKLWGFSQAKEEAPYLQIANVPVNERIDPKEVRYVLVIRPQGIRACGGQFSAEEAHAIANATKGWDWSLDENQRPFCLPALEALLDSISKHSALKGGER